jgi:hypothetical protein
MSDRGASQTVQFTWKNKKYATAVFVWKPDVVASQDNIKVTLADLSSLLNDEYIEDIGSSGAIKFKEGSHNDALRKVHNVGATFYVDSFLTSLVNRVKV